jgi:hypothetical protein
MASIEPSTGQVFLHKHSHTSLKDIGTNTHAQIDTFIGTTVPATYAPVGQTMYIGTTATTINRASAAQTLTGLTLTTPVIGVATGTSLDLGGTTLYASRGITVDTGGVFNIALSEVAGDNFTIDTTKLVVEGDTGNVGIGVADPDVKLEVLGTTGLKISFDATDNTILATDTNGRLTVTPSGGLITLDGATTILNGLDVTNGNVRSVTPLILDDAVLSFTPTKTSGFIFIAHVGTSGIYGIVAYVTATPTTTICTAHASLAVTTGILTGTTGTDVKVTISCHTDGKIYIENRLGGTRTFAVLVV